MKKRILILIACMLAVLCCSCAFAETQSWQAQRVQDNAICVFKGNAYVYANHALMQIQPEQQTVSAVDKGACEADSLILTSTQNALWGLDAFQGTLWRWDASTGWTFACQLEAWAEKVEDAGAQILGFALSENTIFVHFMAIDHGSYDAWLFHREDGTQVHQLTLPGTVFLYPMDGMDACVGSVTLRSDGSAWYGSLSEAGVFAPWGEIPAGILGGITWNAAEQALWFAVDHSLYAGFADGQVQALGQLQSMIQPHQASLFVDGAYYLVSQQEIQRVDPASSAFENVTGQLSLSEIPSGQTHMEACDLLPGMEIHVQGVMFFFPEQLTEKLLTRDTTIDLYFVDSSFIDAKPIFSKGYVYPVDSSEAIARTLARMPQAIQEIVTWDGQYMAVPTHVSFSPNNLSVQVNVLAQALELGYQAPTSYEAYLQGILQWPSALLEAGIVPYGSFSANDFYTQTVYQYLLAHGTQHDFSDADADQFTSLLALTSQAIAQLSALEAEVGTDELQALYSRRGPGYYTEGYTGLRYLPLPLCEGMEAQIGVYVSFLCINPYSDHIPEALAYLTAYLQSLPDEEKYALGLVKNGTIEDPQYHSNVDSLTSSIATLSSLLEVQSDPSAVRDLEASIQDCQQRLAQIEQSRYIVTPESLAAYHDVLSNATDPAWGVLQLRDTMNLMDKLVQNAVTPEQFTQQFLRMVGMRNAEGN